MADNMADAGSTAGAGSRLSEHGRHIKDEVHAAAKDAKQGLSDVASRAKDAASEYVDKAKDYASQGYNYAAEKGGKVKETAQGYIEDNPWYAVGIALGVGVVLGMLLRRGGGSNDD